jgi:hypothetical protein
MNILLTQASTSQQQAQELLKTIDIFKFWQGKDPTDVLIRLLDFVLLLIGGLAVMFAVWSGFQYITSAGDPEKATTARSTLTNVVIGVVVAVLSFVAVAAISNSARS